MLKQIRGPEQVEGELSEIQESVAQQKGHWSELFSPLLRPAMIVGVGLAIAQQVTGINTVIYYGPDDLQVRRHCPSASAAILASVGVGIVNLVMTVVAMQLIDRVGRRPLLLVSLAGMALSLIVLGLAFALPQLAGSLGWIAVASLMLYVGSFAVGLGPVFWLVLSEIYPLRIRGRGHERRDGRQLERQPDRGLVVPDADASPGKGRDVLAVRRSSAWARGSLRLSWSRKPRARASRPIEAHWRTGKHPRAL